MNRLNQNIEYGDRIFARLTMGHRTLADFMINTVADFTELLTELRRLTKGIRGLATLHIRNQSKGWCSQRPLMLYASPATTRKVSNWINPFEAIDRKPEIPVCHQLYM